MSFVYTQCTEVKCCRDCPAVRNTSRDHDDPFTSAPVGYWYCTKTGKSLSHIDIHKVIDLNCPLDK